MAGVQAVPGAAAGGGGAGVGAAGSVGTARRAAGRVRVRAGVADTVRTVFGWWVRSVGRAAQSLVVSR